MAIGKPERGRASAAARRWALSALGASAFAAVSATAAPLAAARGTAVVSVFSAASGAVVASAADAPASAADFGTAAQPSVGAEGVSKKAIQRAAAPQPAIPALVARGDIRRVRPPQPGEKWVALYQANGRLGTCFGPWGLHPTPGPERPYQLLGGASFTHLGHWVRGRYNADYLLPVASLHWEREPVGAVQDYLQEQSFHDGTLRTRFKTRGGRIEVLSWIDPLHRDVAGFRIDVEGEAPAVVFSPHAPAGTFPVKYDQKLRQTVEGRSVPGGWKGVLRCLDRETPLELRTAAPLEVVAEGVRIALRPGRNDLLVVVGAAAPDLTAARSLQATRDAWHARWAQSGWLDLPDDEAQKVWVRSLAYTFASHNDDGLGSSPPNGLASVGWPFPFPFDSGCRQPLLLWAGGLDTARAWLEFWRSRLDGMYAYTRRLWKCDGAMLPHVFPYGTMEDFHVPGPPNRFYYPLYNAGYLVRIAHQTATMVNDPAWTRRVALPLIEGAARFYLAFAQRDARGRWHFTHHPSIGLDESGGSDQPDYLCTLLAAEYTFRVAADLGLDADGRMRTILREGLAYEGLLSPQGFYWSNAGSGAAELGKQKHPDQLFAIVHVPLGREPDAPTRRSYEMRYAATDAEACGFKGHTGGEFILASARMRDSAGWRKDWEVARTSAYTDPDWIQFYETSGKRLTHYVTTHGLFAQAILETVVSTWWGPLELGGCLPWPGEVRFGNIRTPLGVTVSGFASQEGGRALLAAWKDTTFSYQNRTISLRRGETLEVSLDPAWRTRR